MISFQQKVLNAFERIAHEHYCDIVQEPNYANDGSLYVHRADDEFTPIAWVRYLFSQNQNTFCFNGNELSPADTSYLLKATEGAKIDAMLDKWRQLIEDGLEAGQAVETPRK